MLKPTIELMLAGDVMTGRGIDQVQKHPGDPTLHERFARDARQYVRLAEGLNGPIGTPVQPDYIWGDALGEIRRRAPALRIVNLETAITRAGTPSPAKGIHYRMHPANIACLQAAGLDACVLANNHVLDWGHEGLHETLATLHAAGLPWAGAGADRAAAWAPLRLAPPVSLPGGGDLLLFALATESSGVPRTWGAGVQRAGIARLPEPSRTSARQFAAHIARHRRANDRVAVSIHWGENWGLAIPPAHRDFAHALIDAGAADLIHGHSSHHPLPLECYRGKLILYGCGDLINDYEGITPQGPLPSDLACLYFVSLSASSGDLVQLTVVPMRLRRFRLDAADPRVHEALGTIYHAAPADLGPQPALQATGEWLFDGPAAA